MTLSLVVDDSAVDRRLAGGLLEKSKNYTVEYAAHGAEALAGMSRRIPDLVLTDLQMPEMNGLELVEAIREKHPLVPVILMTAHGSEDIAIKALQAGASSYVPKSALARELIDTVENVLVASRAHRQESHLMNCVTYTEWTFTLDNDSSLVPPLVHHFQQNMTAMRLFDDTARIRVGIALEEALLNSLYHGNLELQSEQLREAACRSLLGSGKPSLVTERRNQLPYKDRRIHVHAKISPSEARFVIRDEGPGFNTSEVPDPTDPSNLEKESGRGLLLMRMFMDEVAYNDTGNEVTMVKRREAPQVREA